MDDNNNESILVYTILIIMLLFFFGCAFAFDWHQIFREKPLIGPSDHSIHVECYSGGNQIYEGFAEGEVRSNEESSRFSFQEKTGKTRVINGDCIITYHQENGE